MANVEALNRFIEALKKAPPEHKTKGITRGNVKIATNPKALPPELANITVHVDWSVECGSRVYEVPSEDLEVGCLSRYSSKYDYPLDGFVGSLAGNMVEVDATQPLYSDQSNLYWDEAWKDRHPFIGNVYRFGVYPRVINAILDRFNDINGTTDIHCVDLFGGDGEFVELLKSKIDQEKRSAFTFHIIDASGPSLDRARERFVKDDGNVVVHSPRYLQSDQVVFQNVPNPPKFVTAVGGLCGSIMSRQEALSLTERIYEEMAKNSMFVVSGMTGVLLNSEDFKQIGFQVLNMAVSENVVLLKPPYQLYVLQK